MQIEFKPGKSFAGIDGDVVFTLQLKGNAGVRNSSISRRDARRDRKRTLKARQRARLRG